MALRDWVAATATLATSATVEGKRGRSVATVATVAVARAESSEAQQQATPDQAAELRDLIAAILANDSEADRAEAVAVALADPEAALVCFRALAADLQRDMCAPVREPDDDRRLCTDCANLTAREHRCLAAWRGERPGNAPRDFHPVIDLPGRCECYQPKPSDADQRTGAERWPYLIADTQRLQEMARRG